MARHDSFVMELVYLAVGCGMLGVIFTFVMIFICEHFNIDIYQNLWVIVIPVTLSIILNITFLELYRKYKKK